MAENGSHDIRLRNTWWVKSEGMPTKNPLFSRAWWRQIVFQYLARLAGNNLPIGSEIPVQNIYRVLILTPVLRGDYIVLTPLIRTVKKCFANAELTVTATTPSYELAKLDPYVDRVIFYAKLPGWFKSIIEIIRYKPDIVIYPKGHPAFTESIILILTNAPYRIGLAHEGHNFLLTHAIPHNESKEHFAHNAMHIVEALPGNYAQDLNYHIGNRLETERLADEIIKNEPSDSIWIALNLSASNNDRKWGRDKWELLIKSLQKKQNVRFILLAASSEKNDIAFLKSKFPYIHTPQTRDIIDAASYIARCRLLISPDTGAVHAAVARQTPIIVLYNNDRINHVRFAPLNIDYRALFPPKNGNTSTIEVKDVINAVHEMLNIPSIKDE